MKKMIWPLVLAMALVSGCGEKVSNKAESNVTTITIWSGNSSGKSVDEKLVNEFNNGEGKEKKIYIDYILKGGDTISQSIGVALQTGQAPDFFDAGEIRELVENNYIAALEDIEGCEDLLEEYSELTRGNSDYEYNGKTYCLPFGATTQGLIYSKPMFREAGLVDENGEPTPPKTFEELRRYARMLTNDKKNQFGIILPMKWGGWFGSDILGPMQSSVGHKGFDPTTGKYDYSGLEPIMEAFLGMRDDGSVFPGAGGLDNDPARAKFAEGNIGMKFAFAFDVGVLNDQYPAEMEWGVAPYPVVDESAKYRQRMWYGRSMFVNARALEKIDPAKIAAVYKFWVGDKVVETYYLDGIKMPRDWSLVERLQPKDSKPGWEEFCRMTAISHPEPEMPDNVMQGRPTLEERFVGEVWTGKKTAKDMLKEYTGTINSLTEAYYAENPDKNFRRFIIPDWNIKR